MALKLRRKRQLGLVAALVAVMALAACDTQPATNVGESSATLNAKGSCTAGASGTWEYQIRRADGSTGWWQVGPRHEFSCSQDTGEVAFIQETARYLTPSRTYQFRLVSRLSNGTVQTWDSNGTNGGGAYDSFTTTQVVAHDVHPPEQFVAADSDDPTATAAGCRSKEIKNVRQGKEDLIGTLLYWIELRTKWRYCTNGQIVRMSPAYAACFVTSYGALSGYTCDGDPEKVRAYSTGGNPEHAVYTYSYKIVGRDPIKLIPFTSKRWCATNQISGSGAHFRHGSCDIRDWPG